MIKNIRELRWSIVYIAALFIFSHCQAMHPPFKLFQNIFPPEAIQSKDGKDMQRWRDADAKNAKVIFQQLKTPYAFLHQVPALFQGYPWYSGERPRKAVNLCGWYATFFAKSWLDEKLQNLNNRNAFEAFLTKSKTDLGQNVEESIHEQKIATILQEHKLYDPINDWGNKVFMVSTEPKLSNPKEYAGLVVPFNMNHKIVLIVMTGVKALSANKTGHWIAILVEESNQELPLKLTVADSLGEPRAKDVYITETIIPWITKLLRPNFKPKGAQSSVANLKSVLEKLTTKLTVLLKDLSTIAKPQPGS